MLKYSTLAVALLVAAIAANQSTAIAKPQQSAKSFQAVGESTDDHSLFDRAKGNID